MTKFVDERGARVPRRSPASLSSALSDIGNVAPGSFLGVPGVGRSPTVLCLNRGRMAAARATGPSVSLKTGR